jgi:hypothetical protein
MPRLPSLAIACSVLFGAAVGACSSSGSRGSSGGEWSTGIPRGAPAVVTIENLAYDPPRVLGLVSDDHPAARSNDVAIRKSGIKRLPPDRMSRLLDVLQEEGFVASSAPIDEFRRCDPKVVLRRLTIAVGDERRAFTLPRHPSPDAADRFNRQAHAFQAMFNEIVDFRQEAGSRDPDYFYEVARALLAKGGEVSTTPTGSGK